MLFATQLDRIMVKDLKAETDLRKKQLLKIFNYSSNEREPNQTFSSSINYQGD